jgi:hypothetical protein
VKWWQCTRVDGGLQISYSGQSDDKHPCFLSERSHSADAEGRWGGVSRHCIRLGYPGNVRWTDQLGLCDGGSLSCRPCRGRERVWRGYPGSAVGDRLLGTIYTQIGTPKRSLALHGSKGIWGFRVTFSRWSSAWGCARSMEVSLDDVYIEIKYMALGIKDTTEMNEM